MGAKFKLVLMWVRLFGISVGILIILLAGSMDPFEWKFFFELIALGSFIIFISFPKRALHMVDVYKRYRRIVTR